MAHDVTKGIAWDEDFILGCIELKTPVIVTVSYNEVFAGFMEKIRDDGYVDIRSFSTGQEITPVHKNAIVHIYSANALIKHERKSIA